MRNECAMFEMQIELALQHNQLILIHTPHLDDKLKGTIRTLEILKHFNLAFLAYQCSGVCVKRAKRRAIQIHPGQLWRILGYSP